jgi:membrane protease subunit HflK
VLAGLIIAVTAPNCFFSVSEQERAIIIRFGKPIDVRGAGLHYKLPFIDKAEKVSTVAKGMTVGYVENADQGTTSVELESLMITKDFNFVNVDFYVEYRVSDPIKYKFASSYPETVLRNLVLAEIRTVVCEYNVDEVLTSGKPEIQAKIYDRLAADLEEMDIGIYLINISMQDAEPPTQNVIVAFKNVENAKQQSDTYVNQANKEYNEAIPAARAEADMIVQTAEGYKQSRINEAIGQVARFNEMYTEYMKNKDITRTRLYLEAMEEILPGVKLIIGADGSGLLPLLDLTERDNQNQNIPASASDKTASGNQDQYEGGN